MLLTKIILKYLLIALLLSGRAAFATIDTDIDQFIAFANNKNRSEKFSSILKSITSTLISTLQENGSEVFLEEREHFLQRLLREINGSSWYWMRKIDREVISQYILNSIKVFEKLPAKHPANILRQNFIEQQKKNPVDMEWINRQVYKGKSRGLFYHKEMIISLDMLNPQEIISPFIHELTHYFDEDLKTARYHIDELRKNVDSFQYSSPTTWSEKQKDTFGRYWFLRSSYLKQYKEVIPRFNACLTVTQLFLQGDLVTISQHDKQAYATVLAGSESCQQLVAREIKKRVGLPKNFWSEGKWQRDLVERYRQKWLQKNGWCFIL